MGYPTINVNAPPVAALVAGSDGNGYIRAIATDGFGNIGINIVSGSVIAVGPHNNNTAAGTFAPVIVAGWDGTDVRALLTDNTGQLKVLVEGGTGLNISGTVTVVGDAANGAAVSGNPVLIAGSDGTDARTIATDSSGQVKVLVENSPTVTIEGVGTTGDLVPAQAVYLGANYGGNLVGLTLNDGYLQVYDQALEPVVQSDNITGDLMLTVGGAQQSSSSYAALQLDASGYLEVNVKAGGVGGGGAVYGPTASGSPPANPPVLVAGWDGTDLRTLYTDSSGQLKVLVENSPTVSVTGSVAVTNTGLTDLAATIAATGATTPSDAILVGATNGTDIEALVVDSSGFLKVNLAAPSTVTVVGDAANGASVAGNPVLVAGSDGTDARTLSTDTSGRQIIIGPTAVGSAPSTAPLYVAGSDGTDLRAVPVAVAGSGSAPSNTVMTGGTDGSTPRQFLTDTSGRLQTYSVNDYFGTGTETITTTATTISETAPTYGANGVAVTLENNLGSVWPYNVCARVRNASAALTTAWQNAGILYTAASVTLYFNLPFINGDTIDVDIIAPGAIGSNGVKVTIGISQRPFPQANLRPDGRSMPLGHSTYYNATNTNESGSLETAEAAVAGWRYLVQTASVLSQVAASNGALSVTVGGNAFQLVQATGAPFQATFFQPQGLLCDVDTALQWTTFAADFVTLTYVYDLVPQ